MDKEEKRSLVRLEKFLSLILRHKPETVGLELDPNGWAAVSDLLDKSKISMDVLDCIVRDSSKQRFTFNSDKTKIRANQGHSIDVDVQLEEKKPPHILWHGAKEKDRDSILEKGLLKQSRNHVHLSDDFNTAGSVANRRMGKSFIIKIDAERMFNAGYKFYLSKNGVWLVDHVPVEFMIEEWKWVIKKNK